MTFAEVFFVTKTTRRRSFFASELNPVSILFFSIFVLGLDGQAAIFLHTPEMNSDQHERDQRKNDHVKHVEAEQRVFADDVAAEEQEAHLVADEGHGGNNVRAHGDGPERELVPRQQIAGVAEEQRHQEKHDAYDPVEFVGRFVAAAIEDVEHVPEHGENHQVSGKAVKIAEENSIRNDKLKVFHIAVCVRRGGMVVKHEQDARDEQNDEKDEGN